MASLFALSTLFWVIAIAAGPARPKHPVLEVKLRAEDRDKQLVKGEIKINGVPAPFAAHRPKPFYYLQDVAGDKGTRRAVGQSFLVAGVNCEEMLMRIPTITGVSIEKLTQRARPGNAEPDTDPAWQGVNNRGQRSSFDGFLKAGQSLREVILKDNAVVRDVWLTHQAVATPMLATMEQMMEMVEQAKDWDPDGGFEFVWEGTKYNVKESTLGLLYFTGLKYDDNMKKISEVELPQTRSAARKKSKSYRTGWTGAGIQGSFFNDELYSSCSLTFTDENGHRFVVDCLTPHLIYRYGFYQGGPYRKEPDDIIRFFKLKATDETKKYWANCLQP